MPSELLATGTSLSSEKVLHSGLTEKSTLLK